MGRSGRCRLLRGAAAFAAYLVVAGGPTMAGAATSAGRGSPVVGPERGASVPVNVPAPGWQAFGPDGIASDGSGSLVVWSDTRRGSVPPDFYGGYDVFAARLGQGGQVLDPTGIAVAGSAADEFSAAVAAGDGAYLVVWVRDPMIIEAARVTPSGQVLDAVPIQITANAGAYGGQPAVAWDGTDWLVVWTQGGITVSTIQGARVAPDGIVLDPGGFPVSSTTGTDRSPALAWDGTDFLVTWDREPNGTTPDIFGARVAPDGTVLDPAGFPISEEADFQNGSSVAWGGGEFLVVFSDQASPTRVSGARVTPDGVVRDHHGFDIGVPGVGADSGTGVSWDGRHFDVLFRRLGFNETTGVFLTRVATDTTILDPAGILVETGLIQYGQAAAFDGRDVVVAWGGFAGTDVDVFAARIRRDGTDLDPNGFVASTSADAQIETAAADDGTDHLVVWADLRGGQPDVYGGRVTPRGKALDGTGIPISTADGAQTVPQVAWNGSEFLVVWQDDSGTANSSDVFGARVLPDGTVLDPKGFAIGRAHQKQIVPDVASDGSNFLVVWEDTRNGNGSVFDVLGTRVAPDGTVLDPNGIPIATGGTLDNQHTPAVAFDGTNYLVAWSVNGPATNSEDITAARVAVDGTVLDPAGIVVTSASGHQTVPDVAWNGSSFLVVWQDSSAGGRVAGARVAPDGTVQDPGGLVISDAPGAQTVPAVTADGTAWLVAWQDDRSGTADAFAARVAADGSVLDPDGVAVAASSEDERRPALSTTGPGSVLIAYDRYAAGPTTNASRAFTRGFVG